MAIKRVLLIVGNNIMHGTERYAVDLARYLSKDKFHVTIATPEKGPLSEILSQHNINEFIYKNGKYNSFSIRGISNLFRYILKNRFDVIHSNCGIIPNIIGKILGIKLNIEIKHGILIPDEILENLSFKKRFHEKIKEYFVDCFIAISRNDKAKMIRSFGIKAEKIFVIYNGIDIDLIISSKKKLDLITESKKQKILIGTIGRFTYQKAQNILLEAFEKVKKECSDTTLMILGVGEDENDLIDFIKNKKLNENVILEKYKSNVYDYIRDFDVFVLTSRFEGVPYVLLESMVIGTPIISTIVGGIDNVLVNEYSALLVEKGNIEKIANAMIRMIKEPSLRISLSDNAFNEVQKYSIENMVKNVEELYHKYL